MSRFKTIIALIFAICISIFAVQNYQEAAIKFLFYRLEVSQALIIVLSTALGVIIGLIVGLNSSFKASKTTKQLNKDYSDAQEKIILLEEEKAKLQKELDEINLASASQQNSYETLPDYGLQDEFAQNLNNNTFTDNSFQENFSPENNYQEPNTSREDED